MTRSNLHYNPPETIMRWLYRMVAAGALLFLIGLIVTPERIWPGYLIALFYLTGLGMAGAFFVAIHYVTKAGWGVAIRRIPEAMTTVLPAAGVGSLALFFGLHTLYEWTHAATVAGDVVLQGKASWLDEPFFMARVVGYFLIWIVLSRLIIRNSLAQDERPDLEYTQRNVRYSALFILLGVYTFCLASVDLLMSLQPHWYSTIFGFFNLAGMFQSGLAMIILLAVLLRRSGYDHLFTVEHVHTLGNMLLAFSIFWVYLWASQHMLIWYSNIPEETSYYVTRHSGGWGTLSFLNVAINWLVPFFILMPRRNKRNDKTMKQTAIIILLGRWLDLFIMVAPPLQGATPAIGVWEIGPTLGILALFFLLVIHALSRGRIIPTHDPYLVESLPARTGAGH